VGREGRPARRPPPARPPTAQVVNGLDSTGFSSSRWVSSGHQGAFETIRASDLAGVARVDVSVAPDVEVGASAYVGGTSKNRPKADLVNDCPADEREVAPCGYVSAPVVIVDAHAAWRWRGLRGQALAIYGHLKNADAITARNDRLSNLLGVDRTPVGDNAYAVGVELGYDVAPPLGICAGHALEPYARVERYDTMARGRDDLFDNPRFERTSLALGASYVYRDAVVAKLEASRRTFGSDSLRAESAVRFMTGFVY
jgi:hypothetical protein